MFGLIGKLTATPGDGAHLASILVEGTREMPGCICYIVAADAGDADTLWVTEVWESEAAHAASLQLPSVQAAIAQGRPHITGLERVATTRPLSSGSSR
ncbi:MAG: putative quinol monooxygenase [Myxococcota bacterium]